MTTMRSTCTAVLVASLMLTAASTGAAPDAPAAKPKGAAAPAQPDPQGMMDAMQRMGALGENQKRLEGLVGEWTTETKMWMAPGQPPQTAPGTASNHMLMGGRYLHSLHKSEVMGQSFEGVGTMGYDNLSAKYVSTWADSMMTGIFYQTGTYDPANKTITLRGETPDPMNPKALIKVRTTTRFVDADSYVFEWYETYAGKAESKTIEVAYRRTK